jgi:hypothetical protein
VIIEGHLEGAGDRANVFLAAVAEAGHPAHLRSFARLGSLSSTQVWWPAGLPGPVGHRAAALAGLFCPLPRDRQWSRVHLAALGDDERMRATAAFTPVLRTAPIRG